MVATPISQRMKPIAQRRRDMADQILALQGQVRMAQGIKVLHICSCGHPDCGDPPPKALPADAWVVQLGCRLDAPQQVTPELLQAQVESAAGPTAEQQAAMDALLRLQPVAQATTTPSTPRTISR